jgi:hypothetical protein
MWIYTSAPPHAFMALHFTRSSYYKVRDDGSQNTLEHTMLLVDPLKHQPNKCSHAVTVDLYSGGAGFDSRPGWNI